MAKQLVVIGNGMVGHKFIEKMVAQGADWEISGNFSITAGKNRPQGLRKEAESGLTER